MNIAKIVRITPDGKPFTNEYGTYYPFSIGFDDHRAGQVNAKTNPPGYLVGEIVGYEVTGQSPRGADKMKIKRNPDANDGTYHPPAGSEDMPGDPVSKPVGVPAPKRDTRSHVTPPAPRQSSQNAPQGGGPINGQTVGMATKAAVDIWLATQAAAGAAWGPAAAQWVEDTARTIIQISVNAGTPAEESVPF